MGEISQKEFETYLRIKEFIERNGYEEADLRKMVRDRRPTCIPLIIHSDDIEPKRYERLSDAANDIKVSKQTLIYAYENRRPLITRRKGGAKVFHILNGSDYNTYLTEISIATSEHNREETLYPQVSTSTLLIQMPS